MKFRLPWLSTLLAAGAALLGCTDDQPKPAFVTRSSWLVPAADVGDMCLDVHSVRACWGSARAGDCRGGMCLVPRPLPHEAAPSVLGWRCFGSGRERTCRDRRRDAGAFVCGGARCTQRHPRLPDAGEWTCADATGAALCLGGEPAAGVLAGLPSKGWICGARRNAALPVQPERMAKGRVCVDLSPDFPDGSGRAWRCRYSHEQGVQRICERDAGAHQLAGDCSKDRACVDGSRCVANRCLPSRPAPDCWLDGDCKSGACRFGSCLAAEPG